MLPTDPAWHGDHGDSGVDRGGRYRCAARVFVGRGPELAALAAALAAARAGEPQVVMVQGEAGIGKSSLILEFLGGQRGLPAIAASGETAEAVLPYGVVQQLAAEAAAVSPGVLARPGAAIPRPGPGRGSAGGRRGAARADLLAAGKQAAAVVVEDLQWADLPSARALLFACRRLGADRALVVLTGRPEATSQLGEGWARFVSGDRRVVGADAQGTRCRGAGHCCADGSAGRSFPSER